MEELKEALEAIQGDIDILVFNLDSYGYEEKQIVEKELKSICENLDRIILEL